MATKNRIHKRTALTGGTASAVDGIDADALTDGDVLFAFVSGTVYFYIYDDNVGGLESSPDLIVPDEEGGSPYSGNGRWVLQTPY